MHVRLYDRERRTVNKQDPANVFTFDVQYYQPFDRSLDSDRD